MKYFARLGIFKRKGHRTQRYQNITGGLLHLFTVTIIRFSLHRPFKKKGYSPPSTPCADPVRYIKINKEYQ